MKIIEKFLEQPRMGKRDYEELLKVSEEEEAARLLREKAAAVRKKYYGNEIYVRGLIEFTNYCRNDCYYCGIRRSNGEASRYRLTKEEILERCAYGRTLGFRTFVLQGGEDPYFTDERMEEIIRAVKERHPDCALTLSLGERSEESYKRFRRAGADRYLLRQETANELHYRKLHPSDMSLAKRKQCLYDLKALGYQVGGGFMVGSPGQTYGELGEDLVFLGELRPQMVGIGPFIPHHSTPFSEEAPGSVDLTVRLLSIIRILLPKVLLPATTALGTLDPQGWEKGILAGANVVMPNLSSPERRKQYELYDHKADLGDGAELCRGSLARRFQAIGYEISLGRGDAV